MNFFTPDGLAEETLKCVCDPLTMHGQDFSKFIAYNFKVCCYTTRDIIGFSFGLINIVIWLFAQSPQLVKTYRNKSGGALSWSFLIIWLIGDIANLLGSLFTSQKLLLYTAIYFIIMDGLVLSQIIYYNSCYKWRKREKKEDEENAIQDSKLAHEKSPLSPGSPHHYGTSPHVETSPNGNKSPGSKGGRGGLTSPQNVVLISIALIALSSVGFSDAASSVVNNMHKFTVQTFEGTIAHSVLNTARDVILNVLQDEEPPICNAPTSDSQVVKVIGIICAWVCGVLYFSARIPQAWKIYKEKNVYGISLALFAMSFAANCFYALSILLPTTTNFRSAAFWRETFPYLIGSLGANVFSFIVMIQFCIYPAIPPPEEDGQNPSSEETVDYDGPTASSPSHDHTKCPPHHDHDVGTGQVGELVLEIAPQAAVEVGDDTPGSSIQQ